MNSNQTEFRLTGIDPGSTDDNPEHRRLVCLVEGGGKLVVWGREGQTEHIQAVTGSGFPCVVSCDWIEPPEWAREKYGHTQWVPERNYFRVL